MGERGPELVDLPKGSRVLPNKESVQLAQNSAQPVVREIVQNTVEKPVVREIIQNTVEKPSVYTAGDNSHSMMEGVEKGLGVIAGLLDRNGQRGLDDILPAKAPQDAAEKPVVREIVQNTVGKPVVREIIQNTVEKPSVYTAGDNSHSMVEGVEKGLGVIAGLLGRNDQRGQDDILPAKAPKRPDNGPDFPPPPEPDPKAPRPTGGAQVAIQVTVAKLADQITVREDADIERIGEAVAKRVVQAARNMVPA